MYNTLHCVSDNVTLYIIHHTTIERYIAARIYSKEINIYGDKSVMRLLGVKCLHAVADPEGVQVVHSNPPS